MIDSRYFSAIDLGSSNCRIVLGEYSPERHTLAVREAYRFDHKVLNSDGKLFWDWQTISENIICGLETTAKIAPGKIESVSCDSWGQDFGMLDEAGVLLQAPYTYRNSFHAPGAEKIAAFYSKPYPQPGKICSLSQLAAIRMREPELLNKCHTILHMAELVHNLLGKTLHGDPTLNGISRFVDAATMEYDFELLKKLDLPTGIFPEQHTGVIGKVSHEKLLKNFSGTKIISGSGHDTAGAIFGAQTEKNEFFVSLGSYLMCAITVDKLPPSLPEGCSIVPTVDGKYAISTGGNGMYIQQKAVEAWQKCGLSVDYAALDKIMMSAENFGVFNVNDPIFSDTSKSMPQQISALLDNKCQADDLAGIWRSIYCSMSNELDRCLKSLQQITGVIPTQTVMVSGGVKNQLLTENFCSRNHLTRREAPIESSAVGNLLNQLQYNNINISNLIIKEN